MTSELFSPLQLRSGQVVGNRIAKAAMEENPVQDGQVPGRHLEELYRRWAAGGTGLLITGNVMVHAAALTGSAGVVLDEAAPLESFSEWAVAGRADSDGPCAATAPGPPHRGKQAGARTRARTRRRAEPCDQYASGWGERWPRGRRRTRGAQPPGRAARPARVRDTGCASRVRRDDEEGGYALFCPTGAGWRA